MRHGSARAPWGLWRGVARRRAAAVGERRS